MATISANLQAVRNRIGSAASQAHRAPEEVTLLAVSKTWPATALRAAAACGQRHFGENYLQEALGKLDALHDLDLIWHFIGPLQSNKTRQIAQRFHWVHSVDRLKIAERLSAARAELGPDIPPLQICPRSISAVKARKAASRRQHCRSWLVPSPPCRIWCCAD